MKAEALNGLVWFGFSDLPWEEHVLSNSPSGRMLTHTEEIWAHSSQAQVTSSLKQNYEQNNCKEFFLQVAKLCDGL